MRSVEAVNTQVSPDQMSLASTYIALLVHSPLILHTHLKQLLLMKKEQVLISNKVYNTHL